MLLRPRSGSGSESESLVSVSGRDTTDTMDAGRDGTAVILTGITGGAGKGACKNSFGASEEALGHKKPV